MLWNFVGFQYRTIHFFVIRSYGRKRVGKGDSGNPRMLNPHPSPPHPNSEDSIVPFTEIFTWKWLTGIQALIFPFYATEIRDAFEACDHDGDGTVDAGELKRVMRACGQNASTAQLQDIINDVDHNGNY